MGTREFWTVSTRACVLALCLIGATWAGRVWAYQEVSYVPLGSFADTYQRRLKASGGQWVVGEANPILAEKQMETALGMDVVLPRPAAINGRLIYVKTAEAEGVEGLEAHYRVPQGTIGYVQVWAPRRAVRFASEKKVGKDVYMLRDHPEFRVVAWRFEDSVAAIFSSFDQKTTMAYAIRMRESTRKSLYRRAGKS